MKLRTLGSLALLLASCGGDEPVATSGVYEVTIRRTAFGVPQVLANDLPSAWFGLGYAGAQDWVCILADQIVMTRAERALTFGAGDGGRNIESDFLFAGLDTRAHGEKLLAATQAEIRRAYQGYVAGYNHYVRTTSPEQLPEPCRGASWVKPISEVDLAAYHYALNLQASAIPFADFVTDARPPAAAHHHPGPPGRIELPDVRRPDLGSNAWAIGSERSENGSGMIVGNPHFPWLGALKFYESHVRVPGFLDVYGASLIGVPVVNIGFTENAAWSHTVTPANHFTVYRLALAPGDPTSYLYEGESRAMTVREVTIEVLEGDGGVTTRTRPFYRSHYGPMLGNLLPWTDDEAFTFRDANENNYELINVWAHMNRAQSVSELVAAQTSYPGIPWAYTAACDREGNTWLGDASRVPNLTDEAQKIYQQALASDSLTAQFASQGAVLLQGGISATEWVGETGIVPVSEAPQLARRDFVMNANEDAWLTNPAEPVESYSILYGTPGTQPTARTRMNLFILTETGPDGASGTGGKFSLDELAAAALSNRASTAELVLSQVVERCEGVDTVEVNGSPVAIAEACLVLASWNGRFDLDGVGAALWREFVAAIGYSALFQVPFDPADPVATPHTLAAAPAMGADPVLVALGKAVRALESAGLTVTMSLGETQYTVKNGIAIPVHGGQAREGVTNIAAYAPRTDATLLPPPFVPSGNTINGATGLYAGGYPVNYGTSFLYALSFGEEGFEARALLSYSESSDPASPHYSDQTQAFSQKSWRTIRFAEEDILADPELVSTSLSVPQ